MESRLTNGAKSHWIRDHSAHLRKSRAEATIMAMRFVVSLAVIAVALAVADRTSHVSYGAKRPSYHQPAYHPQPSYHPQPAYHPQPSYEAHEPEVPACAANTTKPWCLEDEEYPTYEIKHAVDQHFSKVIDLYADVAELDTELSV